MPLRRWKVKKCSRDSNSGPHESFPREACSTTVLQLLPYTMTLMEKSRCMAQGIFSKCQKIDPLWDFSNKTLPSANKSLEEERKKEKKFLSFSLLRFLHRFFFPLRSEKLVCKKILVRCFEHKRLFFTSTQNGADDEDVGPMFNCSTGKKFLVLSNKVDSSQSLA